MTNKKIGNHLAGFSIVLLISFVWEIISWANFIDQTYFPPISKIIYTVSSLFFQKEFILDIALSLWRWVIGY
ncbi:MAG: hypothetical protein ABEK36_05550 [Candidatus Aenigmatarchaeota archaeon]